MHVQRYQHANTRPMRPLQTCKHANMRRYQGSRRYQRYQRSRRRKRHANQQSRDHAHANSSDAKDTKDREDTTRKLANETTLPTHAKACVITRDGPQVHAVQPRMPARTISDALADSHTHARASEMHAERIPTRSDSIRMQSRNAHNHASNNLLVRNAPMISPMNLTTERIPTRSDSIRMQSRNAHDAHGISSYTRPRASPLHAEANPTPNQNGRCNEAPLPTQ